MNVRARLREAIGEHLVELRESTPRRLYAKVRASDVPAVTRVMLGELDARLQTATGVDAPPETIELLYHWALDSADCVVTVRTRVDRDAPEIDSIAPVCVAAEWIEREMWELLGIRFRDHPDLRHLLLDDDWPEGRYPLRRDYQRS